MNGPHDIGGIARASKRHVLEEPLDDTVAHGVGWKYQSRCNGIHANTRRQRCSDCSHELRQREFGDLMRNEVGERCFERQMIGYLHDRATIRHDPGGRLHEEERGPEVDRLHLLPFRRRYRVERMSRHHRCGTHHHVETPEGVHDVVNNASRGLGIGEIGLHDNHRSSFGAQRNRERFGRLG